MNILRLFLIAGVLYSWMAASQAGTMGGVINFVGAIVEGPCLINVDNSTANTQCYRNGHNYTSAQTLANVDSRSKELPLNIGTTEMKWIDQQQKLAVMTVVYR